jgi:hypothetical protein
VGAENAGAPVNEKLERVLQAVMVDKDQLLNYYRGLLPGGPSTRSRPVPEIGRSRSTHHVADHILLGSIESILGQEWDAAGAIEFGDRGNHGIGVG